MVKSVAFGLALVLSVGCGGGATPDAKEAAVDSAAAPEASAPAAPETSAAPAAEKAAPAPTASASAAATEPVAGPTTLAGALLGKEMKPQAAFAMMGAKEGTVVVEIVEEPITCGVLKNPGSRKLGFLIPWKDGTTVDPKSLKGGKEPEAYVMQKVDDKKFDRKDWKAAGKIEVLKAPKKGGELGRIRLDTKQGKDTLKGEIDVKICGDLP
jgi:hypothetical protein